MHVRTLSDLAYVNANRQGSGYASPVTRYYFDTRDGDTFIVDDVGVELPNVEAARDQAAIGLAEMAKDVLPGSVRRELAIEVRDGQPVLRTSLVFEAVALR